MAAEPTLRIELLGGFRVTVGDEAVPDAAWRRSKAAGLVKLLALAPGHRLHREQAMDVLWPELERGQPPQSGVQEPPPRRHLRRRRDSAGRGL